MLESNLEILINLNSFRNIDLYEQGHYVIRVQLSCENTDIIQPYLVITQSNAKYEEQIENQFFYSRVFEISYSEQYVELDNSCLFRIYYNANSKNTAIKANVTLLYSLTIEGEQPFQQMQEVSNFECQIYSATEGVQQGIDVIFDQNHLCTIRMYIYTMVLGYRFTRTERCTEVQEFFKQLTQDFNSNKVDEFISEHVDSLCQLQTKYRNLLIQIINQMRDKNMQMQQLMKIPVVQTSKFKTTIQTQTFGQDFLQISNQIGCSLFELWYLFRELLKQQRQYLAQQVDQKMQQNCKKFSQENVISSHISYQELLIQIQLPLLKQREEIWYQARKTQQRQFPNNHLFDLFYQQTLPFFFEDVYREEQQQQLIQNGKHVIVLAHGYQGTSSDMQMWKNFLRIKFPQHLIIQSEINENDTEISITSMAHNLAQEIIRQIQDRIHSKQQIWISFIGHSLGGVLLRAALQHLQKYQDYFYTFISLASPHVGLGLQQSAIVDAGLWIMKKFKKEDEKTCLNQMTLSDETEIQKTCIYKLTQNSKLNWFKNVILAYSLQDSYVPFSSASLTRVDGQGQREYAHNEMVDQLYKNVNQTVIKTNVFFPKMKANLDKMIGRAAHIEFIDNANFVRFSSNLLCQPHNFSPIQELQAINELEYEQEYLNTGLRGTYNSPNFVIKSQLDTRRTNEALLPEWTKRAQRTGVSLMAFFFVKRFVQKIRKHRQKLQNINESHLQLISDQASDDQVMLTQMKFASPVFQIRNVSRLFRQHTIIKPENPYIISLKDKYQIFRKYAYEKFSKIPQFHPESAKKLLWDYFITLIRLILLVLIPLEIAYQPGILFDQILPLTILLTSLLVLDVLIRLNTICYIKGHAVFERFEIIRQQFVNVIFIDCFTIIPLIYFCIQQDKQYEQQQFHVLILLTSLMQFMYINEVIQKSEESQYFTKSQKGIISLLKLILSLMYILHMFSCIWYFNSYLSINDSWIEFKNLQNQNWYTQYLEAFYFAIVTMLTIGYGDNVPKSANEKIVAIFFIMGACLWFSYSVNTIGIIIKDINQNMVERIKKIRVINRYMHKRNIPYGLQYRIREYLNFRWKEEAEIDLQQEEQLLAELSEELKQELRQQSNSVFFSHCSFLSSNFSLEFQNALSSHITRTIIQPQNTFSIFTLGQTKQPHLCFVEQGQLQYLNKYRHSLKGIQCQGQFLQVQDFVTENENTQTFQAIGYVSLLTLSKTDFLQVINNFPKDYQHYCQLKDNIQLSILKKQLPYGVYCAACKLNDHDLIGCPQLKQTIDREVVIKKHLFSKNQDRLEWKRSNKRTKDLFQTLPDLDIIEQFTLYFQNEKQKLIKTQLTNQLIFEQEQDDNPMKSDENITPPPPSSNEPNHQILMRKQDSIILSQNFSSSNNFPPQPISPIHSMINSNRRKQGIMDSQSSCDYNLSLKKGQNHYDFDLKPPPAFNKYTTAKLSMYKKNYLSKYQQQQQQQQQSQLDLDQNQLMDFNEMMQQQIEQLYFKMRKSALNEQLDNIRALLEIEMIYLRFKSEQGLDQFETVKNYELYMVSNNINKVLLEIRTRTISHFNYMDKLVHYMYFPFEYVMKFQKLQQRERSLKLSRQLPRKPGLSISKIVELKNVFQRKRFTPRRSIKITQINPDSEM